MFYLIKDKNFSIFGIQIILSCIFLQHFFRFKFEDLFFFKNDLLEPFFINSNYKLFNLWFLYSNLITPFLIISFIIILSLFFFNKAVHIKILNLISSFYLGFYLYNISLKYSFSFFDNYILNQNFTFFFNLFIFIAIITTLIFFLGISNVFFIEENSKIEFPLIVWCIFIASIYLISSTDFISIIILLECIAFSSYILVGFERKNKFSTTSALQYLILASIPSGFLILGFVLFYNNFGTFYQNYLILLLEGFNTENFINLNTWSFSKYNFEIIEEIHFFYSFLLTNFETTNDILVENLNNFFNKNNFFLTVFNPSFYFYFISESSIVSINILEDFQNDLQNEYRIFFNINFLNSSEIYLTFEEFTLLEDFIYIEFIDFSLNYFLKCLDQEWWYITECYWDYWDLLNICNSIFLEIYNIAQALNIYYSFFTQNFCFQGYFWQYFDLNFSFLNTYAAWQWLILFSEFESERIFEFNKIITSEGVLYNLEKLVPFQIYKENFFYMLNNSYDENKNWQNFSILEMREFVKNLDLNFLQISSNLYLIIPELYYNFWLKSPLEYFDFIRMIEFFFFQDNIFNFGNSVQTLNLFFNYIENDYMFIEKEFENFSLFYTNISLIIYLAFFFILINLCFKLTAAPFHFWAPIVYGGSPLSTLTFLSIFSKLTIIFFSIWLLINVFDSLFNIWQFFLFIIAFLSIFISILGAFTEKIFKRFFVYSSIGHVGFMLLGITMLNLNGLKGSIDYLLIYILSSFLIWFIILHLTKKTIILINLKGLSYNQPYLSLIFSIILFSLSGIPPFGGFFVKYEIFYSLIESSFFLIAYLLLLLTVISFFYYLRLIKIFYFENNKTFLKFSNLEDIKLRIISYGFFIIPFFILFADNAISIFILNILSKSLF